MGKIQDKKILMIVAPDKFRDEEFSHPREIFLKEGADVTIASNSLGEAKGMFGARACVDKLISKINYNDYDCIVITGGSGSPEYLWDDKNLITLISDACKNGILVAAICLSGVVLARAGILKGIEATVYRTAESMEEYSKHGVKYTQKSIVKSGRIITADGPAAAREFGNTIVDNLTVI
ncbi:DJ-1/PfpI family protein [candidate division KSB1 bacterium]